MSLLTKYNAEVLGWQRKEGPLKVWSVVEGRKKTANGEIPKFSIQEMPEDRYEDALKFIPPIMAGEPICANIGLFDDPESYDEYLKLWSFCLQQGAVVGAFLVDPNNPKPVLAGINMTWVVSDDSKKGLKHIKITSHRMLTVAQFMSDLEAEIDVRKFYKVDKYLSAFGLAVSHEFRGQGIANHLLKARDMMAKEYDIPATSTLFSGPASQKAAANAGFEILIEREYVDVRDKEGKELFPGIPVKTLKLMGKHF